MASRTFISAFALALLQLCGLAAACSCVPQDFQVSFYQAAKNGAPYSLVKVLSSGVRDAPTGSFTRKERVFRLKVTKVYGCARVPFLVTATSAISSAACGVSLTVGRTYLTPIKRGTVNKLFLCGGPIEQKFIGKETQSFLDRRRICCRGKCFCAGSKWLRGLCFFPPCSISKPPCKEAKKCVENYCGGCKAEWFRSDGIPACRPNPFN